MPLDVRQSIKNFHITDLKSQICAVKVLDILTYARTCPPVQLLSLEGAEMSGQA